MSYTHWNDALCIGAPHLPAVLSRAEVRSLLGHLPSTMGLVGLLLYGAGLRLMECSTVRVKDIDVAGGEIRVRRGKGGKDRVTIEICRHHLHETAVQRAVQRAVREAGIAKRATCYSLVTRSRRICLRTGTTFERSKSSWGTRTCARR